jgi:hypothetical protein
MSLCFQNATTPLDSNFSADYLYSDNEFSIEVGISLDNIVTSARERVEAPSPLESLIKIDVDLFNNLELTTTSCKRKWSASDFELEETHCISNNKKQCNDKGRPLVAPLSLSSYNFDVSAPIDHLVTLVNESLSSFDVCVFDYDTDAYQWHVTFMGCNGYCNFNIQIFELYQFDVVEYSVEGTFLRGDGNIFEMAFERLSDYVQSLPPLHFSSPIDESTILALYSGSPNKENLTSYCNDLMRTSTFLACETQEQSLLAKVVYISSLLDACRNVPAMKALFDQCYLFRALIRSAETFVDVDLRTSSVTVRWILAFILRCLTMLADFDSQYAADFKSPGNKNFRVCLVQLTQYSDETSPELKLVDKFVHALLSIFPNIVPEPTKVTLCVPSLDTPQAKRVATCATPLFSKTRYHRFEVATPSRGISCSG